MAAAQAADPPGKAAIVGQDVMSDKNRTGPDGWAIAPVTRDRAPSGQAAGQSEAQAGKAPNAQPGDAAGKSLPPGQDPGTPAKAVSSGPGALDAVPSRPNP